MGADNAGLAVMYHYVRPAASAIPAGIRPLTAEDFEAQLDWLAERFSIAHPEAFLASLRTGWSGKPPCLLTFDDGTRDHHDVVLPILRRRHLSGVFFVLTWPLESGRMPLTHALHWLLGQDEGLVWNALQEYARQHLGGFGAVGDPAEARRIYYYESELRARIKYAANMAFPPSATEEVVCRSLSRAGLDEKLLVADWFASTDQVRRMHRDGMTIGAHGCSHRSLQILGAEGIAEEIRHASRYLAGLLGEPPRWFSCPYGGSGGAPGAVEAMRQAMNEAGLDVAVTTQKACVLSASDQLQIPRLDAIDLPPRGDWLTRCGIHA